MDKDCQDDYDDGTGDILYSFGEWLKVSFFKKYGMLSMEEVWVKKLKF